MQPSNLILIAALLLTGVAIIAFVWQWQVARGERSRLLAQLESLSKVEAENVALKTQFGPLIDLSGEKAKLEANIAHLRNGIAQGVAKFQERKAQIEADLVAQRAKNEAELRAQLGAGEGEVNSLKTKIGALRKALETVEERAELMEFGFYQSRYGFGTSGAYAAKLEEVRAAQKKMLKDKTAAQGHIEWTVNGSKVEGKKQINQTLKLLLRAFNGECDGAIARVKYNNAIVMETRIQKAYEAINGLADVQQCRISPAYLDLKLQELRLAHEWQEKVQEEKEEQRRIREQMREEEIALRELEKAKADAERDEKLASDALEKARREIADAVGQKQARLLSQIDMLEKRLEEAKTNKERAISRAQMTKSGHVYVISNIGSFGEGVFKIGMTRRLEPLDRVRELGDASVPFLFDVHAIIYADDAPALEATLHRAFAARRVNRINERREFFHVSLLEIAEVVKKNHGEIEMVEVAEAIEYRKTLALSPTGKSSVESEEDN